MARPYNHFNGFNTKYAERSSSSSSNESQRTATTLESMLSGYSLFTQQSSVNETSQSQSDADLSSFLIGNIFETISIHDDGKNAKKQSCTCDDGILADSYCKDCQEHLCQRCVSAHYRVRLTRDHTIIKASEKTEVMSDNHHHMLPYLLPPPSNETPSFCSVHSTETLHNVFCNTCSVAICNQCILYDHNGHNFQYLNQSGDGNKTVTLSVINDAQKSLEKIEQCAGEVQHMIDRVLARSKNAITEVRSMIHNHMVALEQRERDLISEVEQIKIAKCRVLAVQLENLKQYSGSLKLSMDNAKGMIKAGNAANINKAKEKLQSEVHRLSHLNASTNLYEDDVITLKPSDQALYLAISSLGGVKSSISAQDSILTRDDKTGVVVPTGSTVSFTILARDHIGNAATSSPHEKFQVLLCPPNLAPICPELVDGGNGHFMFRVHLLLEGEYLVSVTYRGVPISESPYMLKAKQSTNYGKRLGGPSFVFGKEGDQKGDLCRPWGICSNAQGYFIVADRSNNRVQIFTPSGTFHRQFGTQGSEPGQFERPAGVAVDLLGNIVVVDKDNHRIQVFKMDGTYLRCFGEKGPKNGQFNYPWDVAVNSQGVIAVTDTRNHRIQLFSPEGLFLSKYGFEGPMWKHFDSPRGIAFSNNGQIVVTDFNNHRLVIIQPDLLSARYLGAEGSQSLQFLRPQGVAIDNDSNIIVADSRNNRLQIFTPSGTLVAMLGNNLVNGSPQMDRPSGLTVTPSGGIAVVDFGNNRVIVY